MAEQIVSRALITCACPALAARATTGNSWTESTQTRPVTRPLGVKRVGRTESSRGSQPNCTGEDVSNGTQLG